MAELSELLEDATHEADGLAQAAAGAVQATQGLIHRASELLEGVVRTRTEIATRADGLRSQFAERCAELKGEAARAGEVCSAVALQAAAARDEAEAFSRGLAGQVESLGVARSETQTELQDRLEEPTEAVATQAGLLSGHEEAIGKGAAETDAALEQLTAASELLRETLAARRDVVLGQIDALEARARGDLAATLGTLDTLGADVEARAREAADRLRALGEGSAESLRNRLDRDAEHAFDETSGQILLALQEAQQTLETEGHRLDMARETLSALVRRVGETEAAVIGTLR